MPRPRLGHIQFINCLPLYYGMVKRDVLLDVDLVRATPAKLSGMLLDGELDIAPIPSIEYARHADEFVVLPDIAISSDGEVQSILLVSQVPPQELDGRTVALAANSRTSQVLARILLARWWNVSPVYVEMPPDLPAMMRDADAALLIGDEAIRTFWEPPSGLLVSDLGAEWKAFTGLPFVFAVWAVRRSFAEEDPRAVSDVARALADSLAYCRAHLDEISEHAARWEHFGAEKFRAYFDALQFRFEPRYREGLERFFEEATGIGQLDAVPPIRVFDEKQT